jgi:hypothetical protein
VRRTGSLEVLLGSLRIVLVEDDVVVVNAIFFNSSFV